MDILTYSADNTIKVHGRSSVRIAFPFTDENNDPVDTTGWVLKFEVDGIPLTVTMTQDEVDTSVQWLKLTRTQIELLSKSAKNWIIVDEVDLATGFPEGILAGTIQRTGFVGAPDSVDD